MTVGLKEYISKKVRKKEPISLGEYLGSRNIFDPEGSGYDFESAEQAGLGPDESGHWPSRIPETGMLLKGITHPTIDKTMAAEKELGYDIVKEDDRYFSKKKPIGFVEAFTQDPLEKIPFSTAGTMKLIDVQNAAIRLQMLNRGDKTGYKIYQKVPTTTMTTTGMVIPTIGAGATPESDKKLLENYINTIREREERGYSFGGRVGAGLSILPAWMIEFAVTGGLNQLGKSTARKFLEKKIKSEMIKRFTGWTAGAATRTTVGLTHRVMESSLRRSINNPEEGWATSIAKGWGETFIEAASETAGGAITKGLGKVVNKLPFGSKFIKALQKVHPEGGKAEFIKKLFSKAGYSNIIGEIGEERLATIMHSIVGTEDFGLGEGSNPIERLSAGIQSDIQNLPAEAVILSVPGAIRYGLSKLYGPKGKPKKEVTYFKNIEKKESKGENLTKEEQEYIDWWKKNVPIGEELHGIRSTERGRQEVLKGLEKMELEGIEKIPQIEMLTSSLKQIQKIKEAQDAKRIHENEGQIQRGRDVRQGSEEKGSKDLQQKQEKRPETSDKARALEFPYTDIQVDKFLKERDQIGPLIFRKDGKPRKRRDPNLVKRFNELTKIIDDYKLFKRGQDFERLRKGMEEWKKEEAMPKMVTKGVYERLGRKPLPYKKTTEKKKAVTKSEKKEYNYFTKAIRDGGLKAEGDLSGEIRRLPLAIRRKNGLTIDQMAEKWSEEEGRELSTREVLDRIRNRELIPEEKPEMLRAGVSTEEMEARRGEEEEFEKFQPEEVKAGEFNQGDKFKRKGEIYKVTKKLPSMVTIKNKETIKLKPGDTIEVDKGEVINKLPDDKMRLLKKYNLKYTGRDVDLIHFENKSGSTFGIELKDLTDEGLKKQAERYFDNQGKWPFGEKEFKKIATEKTEAGEQVIIQGVKGQAKGPSEKIKPKGEVKPIEGREGVGLFRTEEEGEQQDLIKQEKPAYKELEGLKIRSEVTDAYIGQINGTVYAENKEGKTIGHLDYQQYEDEVLIAWIEVDPNYRRKGIGTKLYEGLKEEWKDKEIVWGMTTPEGENLRKSIGNKKLIKYLKNENIPENKVNEAIRQLEIDFKKVENATDEPYKGFFPELTEKEITELSEKLIISGKGTKRNVEIAFKDKDLISSILPQIVKEVPKVHHLKGKFIKSQRDFAALMLPLRSVYFESMKIIYTDENGKILDAYITSIGTTNASIVDATETIALAPKGTKKIYFSHNHPSGEARPSKEDRSLNERIVRMMDDLDYDYGDHVITDGDQFYSFIAGQTYKTDKYYKVKEEKYKLSEGLRITNPEQFNEIMTAFRSGYTDNKYIIYVGNNNNIIAVQILKPEGDKTIEQQIRHVYGEILKNAKKYGCPGVLIDWMAIKKNNVQDLHNKCLNAGIAILDISSAGTPSYAREGLLIKEPKAKYGEEELYSGIPKLKTEKVVTAPGLKQVVERLEPAKLTEIKLGKDVVTKVMRGFHLHELGTIEFLEKKISKSDKDFEYVREYLNKNYTEKDLDNYMKTRGNPRSKEGKLVQKEATQSLPEGMTRILKRLNDVTQQASDYAYSLMDRYVKKSAKAKGLEPEDVNAEYLKDYFRGVYKKNKKIDLMIHNLKLVVKEHWRNNQNFLKPKEFLTYADASGIYNLELKEKNPISNILSEVQAISRVYGQLWLREELFKDGDKKYIGRFNVGGPKEGPTFGSLVMKYGGIRGAGKHKEEFKSLQSTFKNKKGLDLYDMYLKIKKKYPDINLSSPKNLLMKVKNKEHIFQGDQTKLTGFPPEDWERIGASGDLIWKDVFADPELARLINNFLEINRITHSPGWRTLWKINIALRSVKFLGSIFHQNVETKQFFADNGWFGFMNPKKFIGTIDQAKKFGTKSIKKTLSDPDIKKAYREYIGLGGTAIGHQEGYEFEKKALQSVNNLFDRSGFLKTKIGKTLFSIPKIPWLYTNWLFKWYIPHFKFQAYLKDVSKKQRQHKRDLTEAEKIDIIKEGQNFYGEMNERLFGRSGTYTTAMRLIWMAPGFAEGNFRTNVKALTQWEKGGPGDRSRLNIVNSLLISMILATIGTRLLTKKWPEKPETMEDVRDLFKVDTGEIDDKGRKIMIDMLTYDKDYWEIYGKAIFGPREEIPAGIVKRMGGMRSTLTEMVTDLGLIMQGKALIDWKNEKVVYLTDPTLIKLQKWAVYELKKVAPISTSVYGQARNRGAGEVSAFVQTIMGLRPTYTEQEKRQREHWKIFYDLRNRKDDLYKYLRSIKNPIEQIESYNDAIDRFVKNKHVPFDIRDKGESLKIDIKMYLGNKIARLKNPRLDKYERDRIIDILENFGLKPNDYMKYLIYRNNKLKYQRLRRAG